MGKKKKRKQKIVYIDRTPLNFRPRTEPTHERVEPRLEEPKVEQAAPPIKNLGGIKDAAESVTPLEAIQGLFEQIGKLRQENPIPGPTPEQREEAAKRLKAFQRAMQMPGETVLEHLKRIGVGYEFDYHNRIITIDIDELAKEEDKIKTPAHAMFDGNPPDTHDPETGVKLGKTEVVDLGKEISE